MGSQRQKHSPHPFHLSLALFDHYFTASSDMWYHSTTILSAHLLIAFLTLCPPAILALIVIQSLAKIEKEFQFCLSDAYIECLLHTSCWSIYPLAVLNIGYYRGIIFKRKIYKDDYLSIACLSGMWTVDQIITTYFWWSSFHMDPLLSGFTAKPQINKEINWKVAFLK